MNAQSGDALTATYADAMTAGGGPGVVTASTVLAIDAVLVVKEATREEVVVGDVAEKVRRAGGGDQPAISPGHLSGRAQPLPSGSRAVAEQRAVAAGAAGSATAAVI